MCGICNDKSQRSYTHSFQNATHKSRLLALFKKYKKEGFLKYR